MAKSIYKKEEIIGKLGDVLRKEPAVVFGYLFGSQVHGNITHDSDIDIAVYLFPKEQEHFFDLRLSLIKKLSQALSCEADVIILNTAAPFLKYSAIKEGVLVYEHDFPKRVEFELKAMNDYFDYQPIIKLYRDRLKI